jgi:hypothetical protein
MVKIMAKQKKPKRPLTETQRKNLKPWPKGKTGNPNGRPKKLPKLDKLLDTLLGDATDDGMESKMASILQNLIKMAEGGDKRAIGAASILVERAYGKSPMVVKTDITTGGQRINNGIDMSKLDDETLKKLLEALK